MDEKQLTVSLRYYGISPWEIEVIYNIFNEKFEVIQEATERDEYLQRLRSRKLRMDSEEFVSGLTITIPLPFSEEFFKWFELRSWDKVKHIIKEMKRRRGNRKAIIVQILFGCWVDGQMSIPAYPNVQFVIDSNENHNFNSAVEKIDFMVELLSYHLNDSNVKKVGKPTQVVYRYATDFGKWYMDYVWTREGGGSFDVDYWRN
jgi:hypothetical protein